jgi:signal transduction histidine kinase
MPQGNWESALQYSMKALSIYEKLGDQKKCMVVFSNLASIHRSLHNNDRAIYYLEQAKEIAEKENNQYSLSHIAYDLGAICIDNKEFDQALEWELKAMEIGQSLGYKRMEVFAMLAIAEIYQEGFNDYNKAEKYATKAFSLAEEQNNPFSLLASRHILSKIYLKQKRYTASNAFASIVYEMDSTNIETAMAAVSNIVLSNIFLGNKTKSALFFEKYMNYVKQFNDESLHQSLSEMEVKYETEKKETRISQMEQERTYYLLLSVVGGILLLSLLVLFIILHRLAVHKRKLAEARIQQVAIQSVLDGETAERTRLARDLHDGLGGLLSVVKLNLIDEEHLDTARDLLDQSINEMRRVAHHLMPESLSRYGLKTSLEDFIRSVPNAHFYFFGEDKRLDKRKETLIYRCAHELVNNAIKYANASVINVQLVQETDRVSLTVQDNGCGFEIATIDGDGMGMNNLQDRVTAANGKINIYSSPGKGTEIDVELLLQ